MACLPRHRAWPRQGFLPCLFLLWALAATPAVAPAASIWTEQPDPSQEVLHALKFYNRTDGFAVGNAGTILRFVKGAWQNFPSGSDQDLLDVALVGSDQAWAVGVNGIILSFANNKWTPSPYSQALTLEPLHAVSFLNPSNGWACGGDPVRGGIVLHYDGSSWVTATTTIDALYGLALVGSDDIWFCGEHRRIMHFDGSQFAVQDPFSTPYSPIADGLDWHAIAFPFKSIGWVAGDQGTVARFSSSTGVFATHLQGSALTTGTLFAMSMLPDTGRGFIVGQDGIRLFYNGASFEAEASGGPDLSGIALANELEGTAVGGVTRGRIVSLRALTTESTVARMRIFPNPLDPGRGDILTIDRLPDDVTTLEIYTLRGELVDDLAHAVTYQEATGIARWNGHIHGGRPAASGTYLVRLATRRGASGKGVFLVVRK